MKSFCFKVSVVSYIGRRDKNGKYPDNLLLLRNEIKKPEYIPLSFQTVKWEDSTKMSDSANRYSVINGEAKDILFSSPSSSVASGPRYDRPIGSSSIISFMSTVSNHLYVFAGFVVLVLFPLYLDH